MISSVKMQIAQRPMNGPARKALKNFQLSGTTHSLSLECCSFLIKLIGSDVSRIAKAATWDDVSDQIFAYVITDITKTKLVNVSQRVKRHVKMDGAQSRECVRVILDTN